MKNKASYELLKPGTLWKTKISFGFMRSEFLSASLRLEQDEAFFILSSPNRSEDGFYDFKILHKDKIEKVRYYETSAFDMNINFYISEVT